MRSRARMAGREGLRVSGIQCVPQLPSMYALVLARLFLVLQKNPTASCREKQQREAVKTQREDHAVRRVGSGHVTAAPVETMLPARLLLTTTQVATKPKINVRDCSTL